MDDILLFDIDIMFSVLEYFKVLFCSFFFFLFISLFFCVFIHNFQNHKIALNSVNKVWILPFLNFSFWIISSISYFFYASN